jgi:hypothetical protein
MSRSAPRFTTPRDRARRVAGDPFLARLGLLALAALILTPILAVVVRSNHHEVVDGGRLPGAAVAVAPAGETTTVATTAPSTLPLSGTVPATVTPHGTLPATVAPPTVPTTAVATTSQADALIAAAAAAAAAPTAKAKPAATTTTSAPKPKPTTTPAPPPPPPPPPPHNWGQSEVIQIIRDVFPDDLEEHALYIAHRESNFIPTARNYCCVGLFQIYATVHAKLINSLGYSIDQLTDPLVNTIVAFALYQRAGWGPWGG